MNDLYELEDTLVQLLSLTATFRGLEIAVTSGDSVVPAMAWNKPCGLLEDLVKQALAQYAAAFRQIVKKGEPDDE